MVVIQVTFAYWYGFLFMLVCEKKYKVTSQGNPSWLMIASVSNDRVRQLPAGC